MSSLTGFFVLIAEQKGKHNRKYANEGLHGFVAVNVAGNSSNIGSLLLFRFMPFLTSFSEA